MMGATAIIPSRILLVDDSEDATIMLADALRHRGHEVVVALDPESALQGVGAFAPDVAVLDIGLRGMDGYELARRIRDIVPTCRLVALTGYGDAAARRRTSEAGFTAHVVKPSGLRELFTLLES